MSKSVKILTNSSVNNSYIFILGGKKRGAVGEDMMIES